MPLSTEEVLAQQRKSSLQLEAIEDFFDVRESFVMSTIADFLNKLLTYIDDLLEAVVRDGAGIWLYDDINPILNHPYLRKKFTIH